MLLNRICFVHLSAMALISLGNHLFFKDRKIYHLQQNSYIQLACINTSSESGWLWCDGCRWFGAVCCDWLLIRQVAQYTIDGSEQREWLSAAKVVEVIQVHCPCHCSTKTHIFNVFHLQVKVNVQVKY